MRNTRAENHKAKCSKKLNKCGLETYYIYIYIYIYDQFVDSSTNELSLRAYWYCSDQMKILKDQSDLQTDL